MPFDRRVWQEALALREAGFDVDVVCPRGEVRDNEPFEQLEGVRIHRYPLRVATGGPLGYVREYASAVHHVRRLARKLSRERRFDVVHAANPPDLLLPALWPLKLRGARFIFDHHDLVPELYLSRFDRGRDALYWLTRLVERVTFALADVVIATNESYRAVAIERGGKPPERVFVVRSAPDLSRFAAADPDETLKRGKRFLISYLGVMGPQDGVDHALRALQDLRRRRDDWHAVFVGAGDVWEEMRTLAADLGLADVEFTGRVPDEDVRRILASSDVCLAPDPKNPLNDVSTMNKIVEYMAMSRPVVSYDLKEARASAGEAAVYASANDVAAFADGIDGLLDSPDRRDEMGRIGRSRVEALPVVAAVEGGAPGRVPPRARKPNPRMSRNGADGESAREGLRLLVTVTFKPNQLRAHLLPIVALDEVEAITLVADEVGPPIPKVTTLTPPRWLVRVAGRWPSSPSDSCWRRGSARTGSSGSTSCRTGSTPGWPAASAARERSTTRSAGRSSGRAAVGAPTTTSSAGFAARPVRAREAPPGRRATVHRGRDDGRAGTARDRRAGGSAGADRRDSAGDRHRTVLGRPRSGTGLRHPHGRGSDRDEADARSRRGGGPAAARHPRPGRRRRHGPARAGAASPRSAARDRGRR